MAITPSILSAVYLTSIITISGISIICTSISMKVYYKSDQPLPKWARIIIFDCLGRMLLFSFHKVAPAKEKQISDVQDLEVKDIDVELEDIENDEPKSDLDSIVKKDNKSTMEMLVADIYNTVYKIIDYAVPVWLQGGY